MTVGSGNTDRQFVIPIKQSGTRADPVIREEEKLKIFPDEFSQGKVQIQKGPASNSGKYMQRYIGCRSEQNPFQ